jgi:hypothetical protein
MFVGLQETLTDVIVDEDPPPPKVFGPTHPANKNDRIAKKTSQIGWL